MALKLVSNFRKGIRPFSVKNEPGQGQIDYGPGPLDPL